MSEEARTAPEPPALVKIADAAAAGVAPMTVSRVINALDRVSAATKARVREAIERLGLCACLGCGRAVIAQPMFAGIVQAFSEQMCRAGYQATLSISGYADGDGEALFQGVLGQRPDALLIAAAGCSPAAWQILIDGADSHCRGVDGAQPAGRHGDRP